VRLEIFDIQGFRSLANVRGIPLRSPTILTGQNDGGKSATLAALGFLLNGQVPTPEDHTFDREGSAGAADTNRADSVATVRRAAEVIVTGEFRLSAAEQEDLGLPETIHLRRRAAAGEAPVYEVLQEVPKDEELRGIDAMKIQELRALAASRAVEADGPATMLESWRRPVRALASAGPQVEDWTRASRDAIARLPVFLSFSSREEPDPEAEVRSVLQASYQRMLEDAELVGPVRELEGEIISRLRAEAEQLCAHIRQRVPELTSVSAIPALSFRHGFSSVQLRAFKGNEDVGLQQAGAGRQRRISLAVWEWTCLPRSDEDAGQPDLVIAYDEPDTHLDYAKQRELVDLIHAQCQAPGMRMIVATHSLNLIDRVDIADVVQLRLDDKGRTIAEQLVDESHDGVDRYLSQLSAAMGLRTSVLLHERCFLAVEGQTEEQTFPLLFRLVMGKPMQSAGIALISGSGNDGALKVTEFLIKHGRKVVFIVDADSAGNTGSSKQFNMEKLRSHGIQDHQVHFIGAPNELEELYSDDQWADTANAEWPRQDGRPWVAHDVAALRGGGKFSDKLKKLIWMSAHKGPASKQEMNMKLVLRLRTADEVPEQLREKFYTVADTASGDVRT
jgi:hypothetical protein